MPRLRSSARMPSLGKFKTRIRFLAICFGAMALFCVLRLYDLQVMHGTQYAERAESEFLVPDSLFDRGTIYFTTKDGAHIAAATTEDGVSLGIDPRELPATSTQSVYKALNTIVPLSESDFFARAAEKGQVYVPLATELSTTTGEEIQALSLPGVVLQDDRWRYYPGGSLAAQTLGFVGYNASGTLSGQYGLERQYNSTLSRQGGDTYANFFVQLFASTKATLEGQGEGDVVTTIEPSVQAELERELVDYIATWHPQMDGGIIMDPQTGAIVAMATDPMFDLNNFSQADPATFKNPLVSNAYEMGSSMKPLTLAAGIDTGAITASTTYDDVACIHVGGYPICNYDLRGRGPNTMMQTLLNDSLNVGASFVATQMGPTTMRDYFLNHYDFGSTTGIDLPDEARGIVDNLKTSSQLEFDEAAFGQGIAVTPVQMIRALSTLANGGYLVTPHVVSATIDPAGISVPISEPAPKQILKPSTVAAVDKLLTVVVDSGALDQGKVKMDHYTIGAKTGTAQIADPQTGGYYPDSYLHSYFGFFPSTGKARFIIFLYALRPVGAPYASETWSQNFIDLSHFLINYYQLPPDR